VRGKKVGVKEGSRGAEIRELDFSGAGAAEAAS